MTIAGMCGEEDDGLGLMSSEQRSTSKYAAMYDACKQGHRILVEGIEAKLLINKMHQLSTRYRKEAGQFGMSYPAVRVNTMTTAQGVELWFTEPTAPPVAFKILPPSGGTP